MVGSIQTSLLRCRDSFRSYIAQDVFYLDAFAQAYEMAISKAEGLPGDAENVLKELHNGVAEEVMLHTRYAEVRLTILLICLPPKSARS